MRSNHVFLVIVLFLVALAAGVVGCRSTTPAVIVSSKDSTAISNRDSIRSSWHYKRDTTYIDRWHTKEVKGDTVHIHDSIYVFNGKEVEVHDTVSTTTTDTVTVVQRDSVTIYVPVEKELSGVQTAAMNTGYATWGALVLLLVAGIITLIIKLR